jgi:hypothetical protein
VGIGVDVEVGVSVAAPEPSEPIQPARASALSVAAEPRKARREELVGVESSRSDAVLGDFIVGDLCSNENTDEDTPNYDGIVSPL